MRHLPTTLAIPPQHVRAVRRPWLLEHDPHGIGEADRIVGRVGWEQEHAAFVDGDVLVSRGRRGGGRVDDFQEHGTPVLVEPFGRAVDVVVRPCVGAADDLGRLTGHAKREQEKHGRSVEGTGSVP